MKTICGLIHYFDRDNRLIGIKKNHKILHFHFSRAQMKTFDRYLDDGIYIKFETNMLLKHHNNLCYYEVNNVQRIMCHTFRGMVIFYDTDTIKDGFRQVINKSTYRLFLDLEFTMPPYISSDRFYSEIIEYGIHLEDEDGKVIASKSGYIRPLCPIGISDRTLEFLNEERKTLEKAPLFHEFYKVFKDYLVMYQPVIYIWGRNDYLMLQKSYQKYNLKQLAPRGKFVNLMQVMKTYYHIKDDIGLYAAYDLFLEEPPMEIQDHNPLHDAMATAQIFHLFADELNN